MGESDDIEGNPSLTTTSDPSQTACKPKSLQIAFHGSAREYFRIWIVNLALTIFTLGVFSAWAKVRKKRYFYSNLVLDGTPFQYLAQPIPILKGRVLAAGLFVAYYLSSHFFQSLLPIVLAVAVILAPWILIRSSAFNSRYSAYRNITFGFDASYWDAARAIFAWGVVPASLASTLVHWWESPRIGASLIAVSTLLFPLWIRGVRKFIVSHTEYGGKKGLFGVTHWDYLAMYFVAGLMVALVGGLSIVALTSLKTHHEPKLGRYLNWAIMAIVYVGYGLAYAFIQTTITNMIWEKTRIGPLRFESELSFQGMLGLYLTNLIGIMLSAGLLIPWASMRTLRYRVQHLKVFSDAELTEFHGSRSGRVQAVWAETTDLFDLDLAI